MQSVNKYEEYAKNEMVNRILTKVCNRYLRNVCSKDEIESLKMTTLWKCSKNFDHSGKNTKFTSYLYRSIKNNAKRLQKKKLQRELQIFDFVDCTKYNPDIEKVHDILEALEHINKELHELVILKYFYMYTYAEIGQMKGCSGEYIRIKLKKALKLCRKIVYSDIGKG